MIRRVIIAACGILAAATLVAIGVSFVRPTYEAETERLLGTAANAQRVWFVLDSGTLQVKHGQVVDHPPLRRARRVDWGVFSLASVDLPGSQMAYRLRMVSVSLWLLFAVSALYPAIVFIRGPLRRRWRRKRGRCAQCGYDLTGNVSGVCSECGQAI